MASGSVEELVAGIVQAVHVALDTPMVPWALVAGQAEEFWALVEAVQAAFWVLVAERVALWGMRTPGQSHIPDPDLYEVDVQLVWN